jgi:hypothetical protein
LNSKTIGATSFDAATTLHQQEMILMRKKIPLFLVLVVAQSYVAQAQNTVGGTQYGISFQDFLNTMNIVTGEHPESPFRPGTTRVAHEFSSQFSPLLNHKEFLAPAVAAVLHLDENQVQAVIGNGAPGPDSDKKQSTAFYVQVSGAGATLQFSFNPTVSLEDTNAIIHRYLDKVAPEIKKASEKLFNEKFEPALAEAQKAREAADSSVRGLENERRNLQLRSYEELPYEKVADHLADLQRQQLALKLSLVGMEAKQKEIEKQREFAHLRLQDQAAEASKIAASDEMIATLKQLVALREKNVDRLKEANRAATVSASDVDEATACALEAKIQLLSLLGKKQPQVNSEQLDSLQSELTRLAIDRSESQAKFEFLEKIRAEVQERIARRADLDQAIKRIDEALPAEKNKLRAAEARVKELEDAKAAFRPIDLTRNDG